MPAIIGITTPAKAGELPEINDEVMVIVTENMMNGEQAELDVTGRGVTMDAVMNYVHGDVLVQDAFPMLTVWEREQIISGITVEQWKEVFGED